MKCGDERHDVEVRARLPRGLHDRLAAFAAREMRDKSNAVCVLLDVALGAVDQVADPGKKAKR